jgi:co-chaperonin GroES (HSP10)
MAQNINVVKGNVKAIGDKVLVSDVHFGDQVTKGGIIIANDNGKTRGIYPRWGQVFSKGPDNKEEYSVGDWILIEHGRWTRGISIETDSGTAEIRMVENKSILAMSKEKPNELQIGGEYADGSHATIDPGSFINR